MVNAQSLEMVISLKLAQSCKWNNSPTHMEHDLSGKIKGGGRKGLGFFMSEWRRGMWW